jgi:hypothetical protein
MVYKTTLRTTDETKKRLDLIRTKHFDKTGQLYNINLTLIRLINAEYKRVCSIKDKDSESS